MLLFRLILFVVLLVALVVVGLGNSAPTELNLFGYVLKDVPLYLVLYGAALIGLLLGLGFAGVREVQWRVALSRERRSHGELEKEIRELRTAPLEQGNVTRPGNEPGEKS